MSIVYSKKRKRIQPINDLWEEPLQIKIWPITLTFSHSSSHSGTKKKIVKESPSLLSKMILLFLSCWLLICLTVFTKNFSMLCQSTVSIILMFTTYEIDTCWVRIDLHFLYPFLYQFSFMPKKKIVFEVLLNIPIDYATKGQLQILMDGGCP